MKKVRFGIIGADFKLRANMVFENYPKDQSELTAICDHNPAMLEKFRQEHPEYSSVKLYASAGELFADENVDAVFIMSETSTMKNLPAPLWKPGKRSIWKMTIEGCDHILETAYRTCGKLFLGHNMRYVESILKMKEVIDSGIRRSVKI